MSRSSFPRPRVDVDGDRPLSLADLRHGGVRIDSLLGRTGITPRHLEAFLSGEKRPTPWVQREIAKAVGVEPGALWPNSDAHPQRGSFDDHAGRRAAQRNLGAGRSRGARNEGLTHD